VSLTRTLAVFGLCSALTLVSSARAGDREEDEEPIVKSSSVADALVMLGRGRHDQAWEILGAEENKGKAKKAALAGLEGQEANGLRGAARYLGSSKVWGKEDHPRWRAPLEARLEGARKTLEKIAGELESAKPKARRKLLRKQRKALETEELLLEVIGLLGSKETRKELVGLVRKSDSESVIRGATRGLSGSRGNGLDRLTGLLRELERGGAAGKSPSPEVRVKLIQKELERVARSSAALDLLASVDRSTSVAGLRALQRLVSTKALTRAWKTVERAARDKSPAVRAAAADLLPRLRGRKSRAELLVGLINEDSEVSVRAAAASAMGRLGRREASAHLAVLVEALKDEVPVRRAAGKALQQLTGQKMGPIHKAWARWLAKQ
jgi:HEAT repeat protein